MTLLVEVCVLEVPLEALFYWGGGAENEGRKPESNAAGPS
jgi:hypothetical protein